METAEGLRLNLIQKCFKKITAGNGTMFTMILEEMLIQGGALNRGLFFADPPSSLLGAVSGNISEIR